MYTKATIKEDLRKMNAPQDKVVIAHTSLRAVGEVEGRGEAFLDALIEYFTERGGLLLIPTHTWRSLDRGCDEPTLDMSSHETCIGTLPNLAAAHPMAHRSLHPTHSMAVFDGRTAAYESGAAEDYIAGEVMVDTSTSQNGCYGRILDEDGAVILIGVDHNRNTFLHSVEERMGVLNRLSVEPVETKIRLLSGDIIERPIHCHHAVGCSDVSANYPKYEPAFRHFGAITDGTVGNAHAKLCSARKMAAAMERVRERSHGIELMFDDAPLDESYYL